MSPVVRVCPPRKATPLPLQPKTAASATCEQTSDRVAT